MAIAPLENRLDRATEALDRIDQADETAALQPIDLNAPAPVEPEPVQVAGVGKFIGKVVKGARDLTKAGPPPAPVGMTEEAKVIQEGRDAAKAATALEAAPKAVSDVAAKVEVSKTLRPGLTPEAVAAGREEKMVERIIEPPPTDKPPVQEFNLPLMDSDAGVQATIEKIAELTGLKTERIRDVDVIKAAQSAGMDIGFINRLTSGKLVVNPENTLRAFNAMSASAKMLDGLASKVSRGVATDVEKAEMAQLIHFHSVLQDSVKGYQTNIAQSLSIMRIPRNAGANIEEIMQSIGNDTDVVKFAQGYLDAKTPEGKAALIKSMSQGNGWEKAFTVYVNGLLYGVGTVTKNALSSALFMPYRMAERGLAAGIGSVRGAITGSTDVYRMGEVGEMLSATGQGIRDGLELFSHAWSKGYPKDWIDPDKIARSQQRFDLLSRESPVIKYLPEGSLYDSAIWAMNFAMTLPGRTILSTDQFFRGVAMRQEIAALQYREGVRIYDEAINAGKSAADAEAAATKAIEDIAMSPPESLVDQASAVTMSQKIEGKLGKITASMTPDSAGGFALRTQLPFISAPVNVVSSTLERIPGLNLMTKNTRDAIKLGGKDADMALAKIGLGSAAMYGASQLASNGVITGAGPGDKGQLEAMKRSGWMPYSLVIDIGMFTEGGAVSEEFRQAVSTFPGQVSYGSGDYSGKVFMSYQGLEPIGALLAVSADYVDYVKYESDDSRINAFVGGAVFGFANYIMEHPFLQGIGNLAKLMGGSVPNSRAKVIETINFMTETATTVGLQVVSVGTARPLRFVNQVQEDSVARDYRINPNAPAGLKGVLDALNKFKANTPGLSEELPPKLNIWGEVSDYEYSYSPFRMKEGRVKKADQGIIQINAAVSMPPVDASGKDPVTGITGKTKLDAFEYNEMLRIANKELALESRVNQAIDAIKAQRLIEEKGEFFAQRELNKVFDETFQAAKDQLINSPDSKYGAAIRERIAQHAKQLKTYGQGAR